MPATLRFDLKAALVDRRHRSLPNRTLDRPEPILTVNSYPARLRKWRVALRVLNYIRRVAPIGSVVPRRDRDVLLLPQAGV